MFTSKLAGFLIFFSYALTSGGITGWGSGWLLNKLLSETRRTVIFDLLSGIAGFLMSTYLTSIEGSIYEEFYDGKLIARRVTGYSDYFLLIAISGAIVLVLLLHLALAINRKFCRHSRPA